MTPLAFRDKREKILRQRRLTYQGFKFRVKLKLRSAIEGSSKNRRAARRYRAADRLQERCGSRFDELDDCLVELRLGVDHDQMRAMSDDLNLQVWVSFGEENTPSCCSPPAVFATEQIELRKRRVGQSLPQRQPFCSSRCLLLRGSGTLLRRGEVFSSAEKQPAFEELWRDQITIVKIGFQSLPRCL